MELKASRQLRNRVEDWVSGQLDGFRPTGDA